MAGNTQTNRARKTAASTAAVIATSEPNGSSRSRTTSGSCRPTSRNTSPSRRNRISRQNAVTWSREAADSSVGSLCPMPRPVTTTATTPEAWISSAAKTTANGTISDSALSSTGSVMRLCR